MRLTTVFSILAAAFAMLAAAPASAQDGRLLVVNKSGDSLAVIDPGDYEVLALIPTGADPHEVAVSPGGRYAYVTDYGTSMARGTTVTKIDLENLSVAATFDLQGNTAPHGVEVSADGSRVWVTTEASGTVIELDAASGELINVWETGQNVSHMLTASHDETLLFVTNIGSGSVTVIDRRDDSVVSIPTGAGAEGVDMRPGSDEVWITNRSAHTVSVLDAATGQITGSFASGGYFPIRVKFTPDGERAFVSNAMSNSVAVFDADSRELVASIDVGAIPVGILITPDGERAFVANTRDNKVTVIDTQALEVTGDFETGPEPDGMAWAPGR